MKALFAPPVRHFFSSSLSNAAWVPSLPSDPSIPPVCACLVVVMPIMSVRSRAKPSFRRRLPVLITAAFATTRPHYDAWCKTTASHIIVCHFAHVITNYARAIMAVAAVVAAVRIMRRPNVKWRAVASHNSQSVSRRCGECAIKGWHGTWREVKWTWVCVCECLCATGQFQWLGRLFSHSRLVSSANQPGRLFDDHTNQAIHHRATPPERQGYSIEQIFVVQDVSTALSATRQFAKWGWELIWWCYIFYQALRLTTRRLKL